MPVASKKWEHGRNAYKDLIFCVDEAIENDEPDVAVICGYALLHLAKAENASYWGYEGAYNYNMAMDSVKKAIKFAKKEGVPSFLKNELKEMEKDYEYVTGEKP